MREDQVSRVRVKEEMVINGDQAVTGWDRDRSILDLDLSW